jgi:dolichol kinase
MNTIWQPCLHLAVERNKARAKQGDQIGRIFSIWVIISISFFFPPENLVLKSILIVTFG